MLNFSHQNIFVWTPSINWWGNSHTLFTLPAMYTYYIYLATTLRVQIVMRRVYMNFMSSHSKPFLFFCFIFKFFFALFVLLEIWICVCLIYGDVKIDLEANIDVYLASQWRKCWILWHILLWLVMYSFGRPTASLLVNVLELLVEVQYSFKVQ